MYPKNYHNICDSSASCQANADKFVKLFMSTKITPVKLTDGIMEVATNAIAHKSVRIPVIDEEGKPVGIISRRGLKHIIGDALNISDTE